MHQHEPRDHLPCAGCGGSGLPCTELPLAGEASGWALGGVKERGCVDNEGGLEQPTLALRFMVAGAVLGLSAVRITEQSQVELGGHVSLCMHGASGRAFG